MKGLMKNNQRTVRRWQLLTTVLMVVTGVIVGTIVSISGDLLVWLGLALGIAGLPILLIVLRRPLRAAFALLWAVRFEPAPTDLLLVLALPIEWLRGRTSLRFTVTSLLVLLFGVMNLVQAIVLPDSSILFGVVTFYLSLTMVLLEGLDAALFERLERLYHLSALISAVQLIVLGLPYYAGLLPAWLVPWVTDSGRISALFKDPNVAGPFVVSSLIYFIDKSLIGKSKRDLLWVAVLSVGTLLTFSRGAFASAGISLVVLFILRFRQYGRRITGLVLSGLGLSIVTAPFLINYLVEIGQSRFLNLQNDYDLERFGAWIGGLRAGLVQPFGHGPGTFDNIVSTFHPLGVSMAAHSTYVRVFAENGVVGFVVFIALLGTAMLKLWKARHTKTWVLAALVGLLLESAIIDTLHWRHLWVLLALGVHGKAVDEKLPHDGVKG